MTFAKYLTHLTHKNQRQITFIILLILYICFLANPRCMYKRDEISACQNLRYMKYRLANGVTVNDVTQWHDLRSVRTMYRIILLIQRNGWLSLSFSPPPSHPPLSLSLSLSRACSHLTIDISVILYAAFV